MRNQNPTRRPSGLDEMMRTDICHDLSARKQFDMEFILKLVKHLSNTVR